MRSGLLNTLLTAFITLATFITLTYFSCKKPEEKPADLCQTVECKNGGVCEVGSCKCPAGFKGDRCDLAWTTKYTGQWLTFDSSAAGYKSYLIKVKASESDPTVILLDSFWKYKVCDIVVKLVNENSLEFKRDQNVYPGHYENYILTSGTAEIDTNQKITGSYTISYPGDSINVHVFSMKRY